MQGCLELLLKFISDSPGIVKVIGAKGTSYSFLLRVFFILFRRVDSLSSLDVSMGLLKE